MTLTQFATNTWNRLLSLAMYLRTTSESDQNTKFTICKSKSCLKYVSIFTASTATGVPTAESDRLSEGQHDFYSLSTEYYFFLGHWHIAGKYNTRTHLMIHQKSDAIRLIHHHRGRAWYTGETWLCLCWSETGTRHSTCLKYLRVPFHPTVFSL